MKKDYDFSKSVNNPYAKHLKKQITLRLGIDVIDYFKKLAEETGVPYQNLINLYLQDGIEKTLNKKTNQDALDEFLLPLTIPSFSRQKTGGSVPGAPISTIMPSSARE
jgi:hypothetical protein